MVQSGPEFGLTPPINLPDLDERVLRDITRELNSEGMSRGPAGAILALSLEAPEFTRTLAIHLRERVKTPRGTIQEREFQALEAGVDSILSIYSQAMETQFSAQLTRMEQRIPELEKLLEDEILRDPEKIPPVPDSHRNIATLTTTLNERFMPDLTAIERSLVSVGMLIKWKERHSEGMKLGFWVLSHFWNT